MTPEKPKKLLGFQNSFIDATPVRTVHSRAIKEIVTAPPARLRHKSPSISPAPFPQQLNDVTMAEPNLPDDLTPETERSGDEVGLDHVKPFNWKAEVFPS